MEKVQNMGNKIAFTPILLFVFSLSATQLSVLSLLLFFFFPYLCLHLQSLSHISLSSSFKHATGARLEVGVEIRVHSVLSLSFSPLILSLSSSSLPLSHLCLLLLSMPLELGWKSAWAQCGD